MNSQFISVNNSAYPTHEARARVHTHTHTLSLSPRSVENKRGRLGKKRAPPQPTRDLAASGGVSRLRLGLQLLSLLSQKVDMEAKKKVGKEEYIHACMHIDIYVHLCMYTLFCLDILTFKHANLYTHARVGASTLIFNSFI